MLVRRTWLHVKVTLTPQEDSDVGVRYQRLTAAGIDPSKKMRVIKSRSEVIYFQYVYDHVHPQ